MPDLRILFIGETWKGSTARSMREALGALPDVEMDDIGEDNYFPKAKSLPVRITNRLLRPWHRGELEREINQKISTLKPNVLIAYKTPGITSALLRRAKQAGVFTVNIFPDYSPHAYGSALRRTMGDYDLVVSTKPFHPAAWETIYGYKNPCVWVPHGYDPAVHYWPEPPTTQDFDVVLAANWRQQYQTLMEELAKALSDQSVRLGIIGPGWERNKSRLPKDWIIGDSLHGRAYGEWLRRGKIVIAPVHREATIGGVRQPGDEDTIRTYELAAAGCFFLHRRTPHVQHVYDEFLEVPMWDDANELAGLIHRYLPLDEERRAMAARAHARAVPEYSFPKRAEQVLKHVRHHLRTKERHV